MKNPLAVFIALWLMLLTFGAAAPPCLADDTDVKISSLEGNPPTLNMKIGFSVTIDPCNTIKYSYDYYYIGEVSPSII